MPHFLLIFKKAPQSNLETLVRWCAGPMIHVDIVPGDHPVAYTSYMFEHFSANPLEGYSALTHVCLRLEVSQAEHDAAQAILARWVERSIPYNYADIFRCILPSGVGSSCPEPVDVDTVPSLFCSQAVTLALQQTLDPESALCKTLLALPCRFTTPNMLYETVAPFASCCETFG